MTLFNRLLARLFDILVLPLGSLPVTWSLIVVAIGTAAGIVLVMRATSNEHLLAVTRRQMYADLLEMRLFNDDLRSMWRAQVSLWRHNASYLGLSLRPALWTLVPFLVTVGQLECYFGYSGLNVGEPVLVTATLKSPDAQQRLTMRLPSGVRLETPAIWFPALQQVVWRVVADSPGEHVLGLRVDGTTYEKTLRVSNSLARRSPVRPAARWIDQVWNPGEAPLPAAAPLVSIAVAYPERRIDVFGTDATWLETYFAMTFGFVLVFKIAWGTVSPEPAARAEPAGGGR